jgi:uracil-DNA glycosylase
MNKRAVIQRLESLQAAGVTHLPKRSVRHTPLAKEVTSTVGKVAEEARIVAVSGKLGSAADAAAVSCRPSVAGDSRGAALAALARKVAACTRCAELASKRTQTVFGVGNPHARLLFCGEAPGADEDLQGEPFVGRAGQLLTDIIVKGMKMRREDVYILNILRCRPPGNRNPLPIEAANCRQWLDGQLEIIRPEFICCLGAVAGQNLLDTETPIGKLRGRFHDLDGIKVICTYHPAYLLRNPDAKRFVWDDIKLLMAEMNKKE